MKVDEILARTTQRVAHAKPPKSWYSVTAAAPTAAASSSSRVQIYGFIGDWWDGNDSATLAEQINGLDTDEIEVHLNSPGGYAFDGVAIFNALRQHSATVRVVVDGLAASAASLIAMAGDEVIMATGSQLMIHNGSTMAYGTAEDMRYVAGVLDKLSASMAEIYRVKAGGTADDWRAVMDAETWYTAEEAVTAGLADGVDRAAPADDATAAFDLTVFAYAGRQNAPAPTFPGAARAQQPPAEPAEHHPSTEGDGSMPNIPTGGLSERLGISAESSEETILAALDEALSERAETSHTTTAPTGTVIVDEGTLAELQASAALGRAAHERQVAADREAAVLNAVNTGRIAASRADAWRAQLAADPGAVEVLNSLPENTIPLKPAGYTGDQEASTDDDVRNTPEYTNWSI